MMCKNLSGHCDVMIKKNAHLASLGVPPTPQIVWAVGLDRELFSSGHILVLAAKNDVIAPIKVIS